MVIRMLVTKSCIQSVMKESRVTVWIMFLMLRVSVAQVTITTQPSNVTVCSGEDAVFTCVLAGSSITRGDITTAGWHIKGNNFFLSVSGKDRHSVISTIIDDMLSDTLTVTNVLQDDNGSLYRCVVTSEVISDIVSITVTGGIPDTITNLTILPDMITSTSFVAQWSEPSSDPMCGTVQYIVTVYTGGVVIHNDTIERTTYTATGLCSNTSYKVNVSADNIAGNSIPATIRVITTPAGSPITAPSIVLKVQPLTNTSFTVSWTSSVLNNNYTVIWTNLQTGVMYNRTVSGNTNSYTVTGLSGDVNYNVSVATVNMCGMITTDPVTVYDTPEQLSNISISQRVCLSFMVQWDEVIDMFPVTYEVTWSDGNGDSGAITTNQSSCTINELSYDTSYNVTVVAINTCCGAGPASNIVLTTNTSMALVTVEPTATVTIALPPIEHTTTTTKTVQVTMAATVILPTGEQEGDSNCSQVIGVVAGFIGGITLTVVVMILVILVYWCYCNKKKGEPNSYQMIYNAVNRTHHDSISKDSIDHQVFKPQLNDHVIADYSEVVNCAPPPKTVRHKSSSSRTKSTSSSIKESPAPLCLYETITLNGNSGVPRQAIANGMEYAVSTKMSPANVARTFSESKDKEKVNEQHTAITENGHVSAINGQQQTAAPGNGHVTTNESNSLMVYEQVA